MTEEILFVDDEADVLDLIRQIFANRNITILTAGSAAEALQIVKKNENCCSCLRQHDAGHEGHRPADPC